MDYSALINQQANRINQAQNQYNQYYNQSNQAKGNLDKFGANQKTASQFYDAAEQRLGVGDARAASGEAQQALRLTQGLINNLPNSVTGRTQGSLVSEAQRQRLLANEMSPLTNQYNIQSQNYNDMQGALNDLLSQATQRAGMDYQSQQDRYGQLSDMWKALLGQGNEAYGRILSNEQLRGGYVGQKQEADQFSQQMAWERERFDRQQAAEAAARAQQNALQVSWADALKNLQQGGGSSNKSNERVLKNYTNKSGQTIGYDTNVRSQLTQAGVEELDRSLNNPWNNLMSWFRF